MLRVLSVLLLLALLTPGMAAEESSGEDIVNPDHLRFLTERVSIEGQEMALVHIYSEHPDYEWVDAAGEGLSAVDDVARAAVVYLWQYERNGDPELLELARACLNFVLYMQAPDGEFYNFVTDREGTINRFGGTSYKSLGWWAMRGLWALGEGVRVFAAADPDYAETLAAAYLLTEAALAATVTNYGQMSEVHGFQVPAWIPGGEPAVASIGLLGLAAYHQARPNETTAALITAIADGVAAYRLGEGAVYPFGMHPVRTNAPGFWHDWGAHMPHALAVAGMVMGREDWVASAAATADSFLLRHLAFERFRHIGVVPDRLNQIAYGTNMLVLAYMALYEATGEERYARYGGLAASWYFGNNMAGVQMYDPASGRVYDGIDGPVAWRVNRNAGAESTIEGLMSMIAVADVPLALDLLYVQPVSGNSYRVLQAEDGQRVVGTPVYYAGDWTGEGYISAGRYIGIGEGQRLRLTFEVEHEDDYLLYVAHLHQAAAGQVNVIQRAETPPVIDGDPSDWPAGLPQYTSGTERQFLRGAGLWQGPDVDSHSLRLIWDEEHLYILAEVRDPEHHQLFTLSAAWQGDALWLYLTGGPDARALSAKVTLAQTPEGPQVWDWVRNTGFLRGAVLAWAPQEGGYIYEAALPWASLGVREPRAGLRIGFEAGRGIGGQSFMNLTGRDPDVASNLLQMMLVEPGMALDTSTAPDVALEVRLNDLEPVVIPQMVSPDSDYFWLDLVTPQPVRLAPGQHTLRYGYAGSSDSSNPGLSKVDAFYLQPAVARRSFLHPQGRLITLTYDTVTGQATWEETEAR